MSSSISVVGSLPVSFYYPLSRKTANWVGCFKRDSIIMITLSSSPSPSHTSKGRFWGTYVYHTLFYSNLFWPYFSQRPPTLFEPNVNWGQVIQITDAQPWQNCMKYGVIEGKGHIDMLDVLSSSLSSSSNSSPGTPSKDHHRSGWVAIGSAKPQFHPIHPIFSNLQR